MSLFTFRRSLVQTCDFNSTLANDSDLKMSTLTTPSTFSSNASRMSRSHLLQVMPEISTRTDDVVIVVDVVVVNIDELSSSVTSSTSSIVVSVSKWFFNFCYFSSAFVIRTDLKKIIENLFLIHFVTLVTLFKPVS